jgi:hypothetical protein
VRTVLIAFTLLALFASQITPQQVVAQGQNTLAITMEASPQLSQFFSFGVYDTMFAVYISILIRNLSTAEFPGGQVQGEVSTPSTKWQILLNYSVPNLAPGDAKPYELTFKPQEPGTYIVQLNTIHFSTYNTSTYSPGWTISNGFLALDFEPPSTLIELWSVMTALLVGFSSLALSVVYPAIRERKRKRQRDENREAAAYSTLQGIIELIWARESPVGKTVGLSQLELENINRIIADYSDVVKDTTANLWYTKVITQVLDKQTYKIKLNDFAADVKTNYARVTTKKKTRWSKFRANINLESTHS